MRRLIIGFCFVVLAFAGAVAGTNSDLDRGIEAFWSAEFETAEQTLRAIDADSLNKSDRVILHKVLALCALAVNHADVADAEFAELLRIDPAFVLEPNAVAPVILARFEEAQFVALKQAYDHGKNAYLGGDYGDAATQFDTVLQIDPLNEHGRAFLHLAMQRSGTAAQR